VTEEDSLRSRRRSLAVLSLSPAPTWKITSLWIRSHSSISIGQVKHPCLLGAIRRSAAQSRIEAGVLRSMSVSLGKSTAKERVYRA
jgi:hypothetical protein